MMIRIFRHKNILQVFFFRTSQYSLTIHVFLVSTFVPVLVKCSTYSRMLGWFFNFLKLIASLHSSLASLNISLRANLLFLKSEFEIKFHKNKSNQNNQNSLFVRTQFSYFIHETLGSFAQMIAYLIRAWRRQIRREYVTYAEHLFFLFHSLKKFNLILIVFI